MVVAISQRSNQEHGGVDVLEVSYVNYFSKFGITLIPIPNKSEITGDYFNQLNIEGLIISGGGDIRPCLYGGKTDREGNYSVEREKTEKKLIEIATEKNLPILGICRGMEYINIYFGGKLLSKTSKFMKNGLKHDETRHEVNIVDNEIVNILGINKVSVNSFHRFGICDRQLSKQLLPFAYAGDLSIEGIYHPKMPVTAIMWHPEREKSFHKLNKLLINAFIHKELFWREAGSKNEK